MNFDDCFEHVIGHEGNYANNPKDPGGETRFGISKRSYPDVDIKSLTLDQAKAIYLRDFWNKAGCDRVPDVIRFDLFDAAVNSGVGQAVKWLQTASGASVDGIVGTQTLAKVWAMHPAYVLAHLNGQRLQFMTDLPTWPTFGKGWARRIADNLTHAGSLV